MPIHIRLRGSQLVDLERIREVPAERLRLLAEHIESQIPPPLLPSDLETIVSDTVGSDKEVVESVVRQLVSLSSLRRQTKLSPEEVFSGLQYGINTSEHPWDKDQIERWRALEPELRLLLDSPRIAVVSKALDLSYNYANLLQDVRILTDIRPVFDTEATQIEGAVVSFTLRLRYDSRDDNHDLSLAMNSGDVKELLDECTRALQKSKVAVDVMNQKAQIRTIISGDDDDD
jgi:hypothetical protein